MSETISETLSTLTLFLGAIAAISLLVGAVGVANSMFTSVLEKTREIGILKALGATENEVLLLFIFESGLFGFVGGVLGILLSYILSYAMLIFGITLFSSSSQVYISPVLIIGAIIMSTLIGIVSGVFPARSASKLKPIEVLRQN